MVVYIHIFPNGKRYVGLTMRDVNKRWGKNGIAYKRQKVVYNAILKYGWKNIQHIVYNIDTESEMKYLERYLIAYYNTTDHRYGYNVTEGGDASLGIPSKKRRLIDQYDRQGNFIKTWDSIMSIGQTLNLCSTNISDCVRKNRPTAYGFYWVYSGETPEFKTYKTQRKVYQYNLNGDFIAEFKNAVEAGKSIGKPLNGNINACCNGLRKTAYNYIWKYENDNFTQTI